ncbi:MULTISPECIES: hypothetical protein [unclassified Carboxylicivirga]|uniref:hypothetical protein n=1 Tax=Carboxylicivirga TaxID=1628153 RepID=UPI003D335999
MNRFLILLFLSSLLVLPVFGQEAHYRVSKLEFCSDRYDEIAPVRFQNMLIFCSNRSYSNFVKNVGGNQGEPLNIFQISLDKKNRKRFVRLFSKALTTAFNDGPVTFGADYQYILFSRNLNVDPAKGSGHAQLNKLGIFSADNHKGEWFNIQEAALSNDWFNVTTPCLSHDGQRIFFASDKPGGYGGMDLYVSYYQHGHWSDPVNLGSTINTAGNEIYPFLSRGGELYFSSDGHQGYGGKDIFVTTSNNDKWTTPMALSAPINTEYDEIGVFIDAIDHLGYFSSNRLGNFDIFQFEYDY